MIQVRNPRTGELDYAIDPLDALRLAALATDLRDRQAQWASRSTTERAEMLRALGATIARHADAIGTALTIDTGRRAISRIEVEGTARTFDRWAGLAPDLIARSTGEARPSATPGVTVSTRLVPYPLVGVISPWNFPLTLALIDAIPALAAGCAVIVKPSEVTPRFIRPLMAAIAELPEVPLVVIEGDGATGAALVNAVDYVAFTGSVATGRKVAAAAAAAFIPASLELGGKDPMIVLASADPAWAAQVALRASIVNTGQACQSIERVYVARQIAEPFLSALVAGAQAVRLNAEYIGSGEIGPFIFVRQAEIVQAQIDDAVAKGATVLAGGTVEIVGGGHYLRPTVLIGVTPDMAIMAEETFGPVIPVTVFDTIDQAVGLANGGVFGLSAAVLARSPEEAEAVAIRLNAGAISINDGSLTAMVWDAEKSSFGASGLGPSRMGDSGLLRFVRKQALLRQTGTALPIQAYAEDARR
ncbi:MAG: aldehyde dehydrogenase [Sphingomonas sp. 28-62-20]|uniref:aldehyde dehydrogenase family protein n=1 Tax=Sphingomonas sp. 28-62-20 TaxID=1970433 RepID=UPI000BDBA856|nr:MAG: aldehyde dehydrogenase [Sphingomonas sp. 28-62-20]